MPYIHRSTIQHHPPPPTFFTKCFCQHGVGRPPRRPQAKRPLSPSLVQEVWEEMKEVGSLWILNQSHKVGLHHHDHQHSFSWWVQLNILWHLKTDWSSSSTCMIIDHLDHHPPNPRRPRHWGLGAGRFAWTQWAVYDLAKERGGRKVRVLKHCCPSRPLVNLVNSSSICGNFIAISWSIYGHFLSFHFHFFDTFLAHYIWLPLGKQSHKAR